MNLEEAQGRLLQVREQQKKLTVEINELKAIVIGYGVEPYRGFTELKERSNEIYKLHKKGISFTSIAKKYNLSPTRIASICLGIDHKKAMKKLYPILVQAI